jgi:hypothetical protein
VVSSTIVQRLLASWKVARAWFGVSTAERTTSIAMVLCVVFGLGLRARGFLFEPIPFWNDEASWAMKTVTLPLGGHLIRPIGFMAVSKLAATLFGLTETALRLLPWCAGVFSTLALPWIARRLYGSLGAQLLFVAAIAFHPAAIDLSKEFKPYSVSLALHLVLLALALRYAESGRRLVPLLATAVLGGLFAQDVVFAYPGLFLVVGIQAYRQRKHRELVAIVGSAALILAMLVAQYFLIWHRLSNSDSDYWGEKYNVFHITDDSYASWWFSRYSKMADIPGLRRDYWALDWLPKAARGPLYTADSLIWSLLHVAGLAIIALRRQWQHALLLVLPLATVTLFNVVGFWPLGAFRTNLFVIAYVVAIAGKALDTRPWRASVLAIVPTLLLVALPLVFFERHWHADKRVFTYSTTFPQVLRELIALHDRIGEKREPLLVDDGACKVWRYYVEYHPRVSKLRAKLARRFDAHCADHDGQLRARIRAVQTSTGLHWLLAHSRIRVSKPIEELLGGDHPEGFVIVDRSRFGSHTVFAYRSASDATAAKEPSKRRKKKKSDHNKDEE